MSMSLRSNQVKEETGRVWSERWAMKPSVGGLVTLKTKSCWGVSSSSASTVAVDSGVRMNWSTSRMSMDMKDAFGGWLGTAPSICTGIHACSDWRRQRTGGMMEVTVAMVSKQPSYPVNAATTQVPQLQLDGHVVSVWRGRVCVLVAQAHYQELITGDLGEPDKLQTLQAVF